MIQSGIVIKLPIFRLFRFIPPRLSETVFAYCKFKQKSGFSGYLSSRPQSHPAPTAFCTSPFEWTSLTATPVLHHRIDDLTLITDITRFQGLRNPLTRAGTPQTYQSCPHYITGRYRGPGSVQLPKGNLHAISYIPDACYLTVPATRGRFPAPSMHAGVMIPGIS